MEHFPSHPENVEPSFNLIDAAHHEIAGYGGIANFIRASVNMRTTSVEGEPDDVHRPTLRRMERIARAIAAPDGSLSGPGDQARANAFYWGEIIAMEIGDLSFESEPWAEAVLKRLSAFETQGRQQAHKELIEPTFHLPSAVKNVSPDSQRAILAAGLMIDALEDPEDEIFMPNPLQELIDRYAAELAPDDEGMQHYVQLGYRLVVTAFVSHMDEILKNDSEISMIDSLEEELQDAADWSELARKD